MAATVTRFKEVHYFFVVGSLLAIVAILCVCVVFNTGFVIYTLVNVYVDVLVFTRIAGTFIDPKWLIFVLNHIYRKTSHIPKGL